MSATEAYAGLRRLNLPFVSTADAAAALGASVDATNKTLRRLSEAGLVHAIRRGLWSMNEHTDPLLLADVLTTPYPSYVSLQTALYLHGMIEQIPAVTYLVTLGRSKRIRTSAGDFSAQHVAPEFFGGFNVNESGMKLASPEKALLDIFYLSATRNRLFASLPEVQLPRSLDKKLAIVWIRRISSGALAAHVERRWEALVRGKPKRGKA